MSERSAGGFLTGLLIGAAVGAGVALLFAPSSGSDTRRKLGRRLRQVRRDAEPVVDDARRKARQLAKRGAKLRRRLEEVADDARDRISDVI